MNIKNFIISLLAFLIIIQCKKNETEKPFIEIGKDIAQQAKVELGKNLKNAIESKGTVGAIEFCSLKAISLTYELSQKLNVKLKRVSDKPRNPANSANEEEIKIIEKFKYQILRKENLIPVTVQTDKAQIGFYPIETNTMCLQCHGDLEKNISKEVSNKLSTLYPVDKAINYTENQIRGMWVVERSKDLK